MKTPVVFLNQRIEKYLVVAISMSLSVIMLMCDHTGNTPGIVQTTTESSTNMKALHDEIKSIATTSGVWTFKLTAGQIKCAAQPGMVCQTHEWRATFEAQAIDANGVNQISGSNWTVTFFAQKSAVQPTTWAGPFTNLGCYQWKALLEMDGEWYNNISPQVWWIKAHISNPSLNINIDLIGKCDFLYPEITPDRIYSCALDYNYNLGCQTLALYTMAPPTVSINGPTLVIYPAKNKPPVTKTWTAVVSGGQSPYTYQWYRKVGTGPNVLVSTSSSYSKTYLFIGYSQYYNVTLTLNVTDVYGQTGTGTLNVIEESADLVQY